MKPLPLLFILISLSGLTCVLSSCDEIPKSTVPDSVTILKVPEANDKMSVEDIYDSIRFIRLEARPECLITDVLDMQIFDNKFYIISGNGLSIYVFDYSGRYLNKFEQPGRGPNEYVQLLGFCIDPVSRKVVAADPFLKKLFILDENLNLVKITTTDFRPEYLIGYRNNVFINMQTDDKKSTTSEIIKKLRLAFN